MIANLASDQFGIRGQRIERKGDRKRLLDLQRAVSAREHDAVEAASIQRQPHYAGAALTFQGGESKYGAHKWQVGRNAKTGPLSPSPPPTLREGTKQSL